MFLVLRTMMREQKHWTEKLLSASTAHLVSLPCGNKMSIHLHRHNHPATSLCGSRRAEQVMPSVKQQFLPHAFKLTYPTTPVGHKKTPVQLGHSLLKTYCPFSVVMDLGSHHLMEAIDPYYIEPLIHLLELFRTL